MDNLKRNNSDSDLSDEWSVVSSREAPHVSESESIEVLDDEDGDDDDDDDEDGDDNEVENEDATERRIINSTHNDCTSERANEPNTSNEELPVSRIEEMSVEPVNASTKYCVYPEEFHDVIQNTDGNLHTSELLCSVSLVILCTIASSLMVINADNLMPSFIDVLVWQSLPDNQKDIDFKNAGLLKEQLDTFKSRNELLENKFNHLNLAVKAFEENMISETALAEFVTDLQKTLPDDLSKNDAYTTNDAISSLRSSAPVDRSDESLSTKDIEKSESVVKEPFLNVEDVNEKKITPGLNSDKSEVPLRNFSHKSKNVPVKLLSSVLSLFNTTSETGLLLNKASLMLLNSKDKLFMFKKSVNYSGSDHANGLKFSKFSDRIINIENNINAEINKFFNTFSKKLYNNLVNLNENLDVFICRNYKSIGIEHNKLNDLCSPKTKYDKKKHGMETEESREKKSKYKKTERSRSDSKTSQYYDKSYKTNQKNIGKNIEDSSNNFKNTKEFDKHKMSNRKNFHRKIETPLSVSDGFASTSDENEKNINKQFKNSIKTENFDGYKTDTKETGEIKDIPYDNRKSNDQQKTRRYSKSIQEGRSSEKEGNKHREKKIGNKYNEVVKPGNNDYYKFHKSSKYQPRTNENDKNTFSEMKNNIEKIILDGNDLIEDSLIKDTDDNEKVKIHETEKRAAYETIKYDKKNQNKKQQKFDKVKTENFKKDKKGKEDYIKENGKINNDFDKRRDSSFENDGLKKTSMKNNLKHNSYKQTEKLGFEDFKKLKEDILSSLRNYVDDLLTEMKYFSSDYYKINNSTSHRTSNFISGDWFLTLGKKRSEIREKEMKSQWLFDRAHGRNNLRDLNTEIPYDDTFYEKTYWFFRRAWERNRIRL